MKKKGVAIALNAIVVVVLAVAVLIVVSLFLTRTGGEAIDDKITLCRLSVSGASVDSPLGSTPSISVNCPSEFVKIEKGSKSVGYKGGVKVYRVDTKEELINAVMTEVGNCWYKFGEGADRPFGNLGEEDYRCVVCSEISFDQEVADSWPSISGEEVMRVYDSGVWKYKNVNKNYSKFLTNFVANENIKLVGSDGLAEPYSMMFIEVKESLRDEYVDATIFFGTFLIPGGGLIKLGKIFSRGAETTAAAGQIGKIAKTFKALGKPLTTTKQAAQVGSSAHFVGDFYIVDVEQEDAPSIKIGGFNAFEEEGIFGLEGPFSREAVQSYGLWKARDLENTKCAQLY